MSRNPTADRRRGITIRSDAGTRSTGNTEHAGHAGHAEDRNAVPRSPAAGTKRSDMSRVEMVNRLVAHSVKTAIVDDEGHYWLSELFEKGFAGYANLSARQLALEMQLRGLTPAEDAADETLDIDQDLEAEGDAADLLGARLPIREGLE